MLSEQYPTLKGREYAVVAYICDGFSSKEISGKLNLSKRTTEGVIRRLKDKHKAKNTTHLVITLISNNQIKL